MLSRSRSLIAASLLTATAGFAAAQEAGVPALPAPPAGAVAALVAQPKSAVTDAAAENRSRANLLIGEWLLAGVLMGGIFALTTMLRQRRVQRSPVAVDVTDSPKLKTVPATRS